MKKRIKWWTFLFPVAFLSLSSLILVEGATPGNESSVQSKWFAAIFDRGQEEAPIVAPSSLSMEKDVYTVYVGESLTLNPVFTPVDASDKRVYYNCLSSLGVASIEGDTLKGEAEGETEFEVISQANPSLTSRFNVLVLKESIQSLELSMPESSLIKGMSAKLSVSSNKKETSLDEVGFVSSNPDVAYVDVAGYVHTLSAGETSISCYSKEDASVSSAEVTLEVRAGDFTPATSMDCPDELSIYVGENRIIEPTFNLDCSDKNFYASSLPEGLAFEDGVLSCEREGEFVVTFVSVNNPSLICKTKVKALEVKPVSISVSFSSIQYGKTEKLDYSLKSEVEGLPVTYPAVNFLSSDQDIANVDENGYLVGFKKGSVDITVSWDKDPSIKGKATIAITAMEGERFDNINYIVRKAIGHFGSFCLTAVFGVLTCFFFLKKKIPFWVGMASSLVYGLLLAMLSELLQIFTSNRGPSWNDVGIDFFGYSVGFAVTFLIAFFIHRTLSKRRGASIDNHC